MPLLYRAPMRHAYSYDLQMQRVLNLRRMRVGNLMPRAASIRLFHPAVMLRTVEAIVERDGSLRLLEDIDLRVGERALVTLLGDDGPDEPAFLSQASLGVDWNREEEDDAWSHLQ